MSHTALCSLAEISAPLLFESRGSRWDALCTLCRRTLLEGGLQAHEARHAAALALGALVAAPWAADSAVSEASEVERGGGGGQLLVLRTKPQDGMRKRLCCNASETQGFKNSCSRP